MGRKSIKHQTREERSDMNLKKRLSETADNYYELKLPNYDNEKKVVSNRKLRLEIAKENVSFDVFPKNTDSAEVVYLKAILCMLYQSGTFAQRWHLYDSVNDETATEEGLDVLRRYYQDDINVLESACRRSQQNYLSWIDYLIEISDVLGVAIKRSDRITIFDSFVDNKSQAGNERRKKYRGYVKSDLKNFDPEKNNLLSLYDYEEKYVAGLNRPKIAKRPEKNFASKS